MPNLICKLLLWCVLSSFLAAGAKAQEPEAFRGIFCTVVTLGRELGGAQEGILAVNREAPNSCFFGTIVGVRQTAVARHADVAKGLVKETAESFMSAAPLSRKAR